MKRIEIPQAQKDINVKKRTFDKKAIPQISFNKNNLPNLEKKLQQMKISNYQSDFVDEFQKVLDLYSDEELHYSYELVLSVMQEVEKYILKSKSGEYKKALVIEICKKYFNNDEELVILVIDLVFKKLKQIKFCKRQVYKLMRFFSKIMSKVMSSQK